MRTESFKGALLSALVVVSLVLYTIPVAHTQGEFSVQPVAFTVRDAPPMGQPYTSPTNIVVWNLDNVDRVVSITTEIPPENAVTSGYEPIPNANWVIPSPASILINENSFAIIQLSLNIPRWENLTGKKWEVWIPVERQALPGENIVLRPTVRMKIETTEELPPPPPPPVGGTVTPVNKLALVAPWIALAAIIAIVTVSVAVYWRRR